MFSFLMHPYNQFNLMDFVDGMFNVNEFSSLFKSVFAMKETIGFDFICLRICNGDCFYFFYMIM